MPLIDEVRHEQRVAEVIDLAIQSLVVDCSVSSAEAAAMLLAAAARTLTPGAVAAALRSAQR